MKKQIKKEITRQENITEYYCDVCGVKAEPGTYIADSIHWTWRGGEEDEISISFDICDDCYLGPDDGYVFAGIIVAAFKKIKLYVPNAHIYVSNSEDYPISQYEHQYGEDY
jgi:hypothetical protein